MLDGKNLIAPPSGIVDAIVDNWSLYQRAIRTTLWEAARGFLWGNLAAVALAALVAVVPGTERVVLRVALVDLLPAARRARPAAARRLRHRRRAAGHARRARRLLHDAGAAPRRAAGRARRRGPTSSPATAVAGSRTLTTVRARAAVPYLFAGLQVAAPAAFLGALVGEFTGAERGVGLLTINAMRGLRTDELWAVATISALVSMAAYRARRGARSAPRGRPAGAAARPAAGAPAAVDGAPVR